MSRTDVEQILLNLKIIGMLRQHERFSTQNNIIIVEKNSFIQGLKRWLRGEKRDLNLQFLQEVFNRAFSFLDSIMPNIALGRKSRTTSVETPLSITNMLTNMPTFNISGAVATLPSTIPSMQYSRDIKADNLLCVRVLKEIHSAIKGITNLQTTYETDSLVVAQVQVMIDSIQSRLQIYDNLIKGLD